jgi:hypothetical protein
MENGIPMKFGMGEYFPTPRAQKSRGTTANQGNALMVKEH